MIEGKGYVAIGAFLAVLSVGGAIWGFSAGAHWGNSGGRVWDGDNCTSCHVPFHVGTGRAELIGAPTRYRADEIYDLTVRVIGPEEDGASFEISAESDFGWVGELLLVSDDVRTCQGGSNNGDLCVDDADCGGSPCDDSSATQFASPQGVYVTHTIDGVMKSLADWNANGGQYDFNLQWQAPSSDSGPVTFFVAANAVVDDNGDITDDNEGQFDVRYYATFEISHYAVPGDGDGDGDLDLADLALMGRCFGDTQPFVSAKCAFLDMNDDGAISLDDYAAFIIDPSFADPPSLLPGSYVLADPIRGGLLYDKWWKVNFATEPTGDHPLYPAVGQKSGSSTFRCKECHGWDYKGVDGIYGLGSHFTGIGGIFGTARSPQQLFDLLKSSDTASDGHDMAAYGMTDRDLWDVVKLSLEGIVDTDDYVDVGGAFIGDLAEGEFVYGEPHCTTCHGYDGLTINFGTTVDPVWMGTVAIDNPWEFLHKTRFGHPGSAMPSTDLFRWSVQTAADIGKFSQTLPQ